jgi:hypothetical protein
MNVKVVTGSQSNKDDLQRWIAETGGNFDVIIDDGGHTAIDIHTAILVGMPCPTTH